MNGWTSKITLIKVITVINSIGASIETQIPIIFQGVIQPLSPKQLTIKPEGERAWEWLQIHTATQLALNTGDRIKYNTKLFKVMAQNNYSLNNYYEYHIAEDFQEA